MKLPQTIAHEIGHNLNMEHDFDPSPGNTRTCTTDGSSCTDIGGVMDYFGVSPFYNTALLTLLLILV
jgi:hypothetical protein